MNKVKQSDALEEINNIQESLTVSGESKTKATENEEADEEEDEEFVDDGDEEEEEEESADSTKEAKEEDSHETAEETPKAGKPIEDSSQVATEAAISESESALSDVEMASRRNILSNNDLMATIENAKKESEGIQSLLFNLDQDISKKERKLSRKLLSSKRQPHEKPALHKASR